MKNKLSQRDREIEIMTSSGIFKVNGVSLFFVLIQVCIMEWLMEYYPLLIYAAMFGGLKISERAVLIRPENHIRKGWNDWTGWFWLGQFWNFCFWAFVPIFGRWLWVVSFLLQPGSFLSKDIGTSSMVLQKLSRSKIPALLSPGCTTSSGTQFL